MDSWYELVDLASGIMVEDYEREQDVTEALMRVEQHGSQAIATCALAHVEGSRRCLVATEADLALRVEQAMRRRVPRRHTS